MKKNTIRKIDFKQINSMAEAEYSDEDIAFLSDIQELPHQELPIALDMFMLIVCEQGEIQIQINDVPYTISDKMLLVCMPNELISNYAASPDFRGKALCISHRVIIESFSDSDFWDRGLVLANRHIIKINDEDIALYYLYGELLQTKVKKSGQLFMKQILQSLVKTIIYELLATFDEKEHIYGKGLVKQREVLFQKFIVLLSSQRVKPRNVSWYADQLCVSTKHLSTTCKQISNKTAFEWINNYVQIDIQNLLKYSNKSIKEIADYLAFPTISFFGKYVKSYTGLSPTDYRRKLREQKAEEE